MPQPENDWGLNYPRDYVMSPWEIWRLSNYSTWPNGKCYDEQPDDLVQDFVTLNEDYAYQVHHLKKPTVEKPKSFSDL